VTIFLQMADMELGDWIKLLGACYNAVTPIYHDYRQITEDIVTGKITDIERIEHFLDTLMEFYFDHRFVYLYKRICRYLLPQNPKMISEHIRLFIELYGDGTMSTITTSFTVDEVIYEDAKAILDTLGISMEEAINLFLKAVVARKSLPFPLSEQDLDLIRNKRMGGSK